MYITHRRHYAYVDFMKDTSPVPNEICLSEVDAGGLCRSQIENRCDIGALDKLLQGWWEDLAFGAPTTSY